jgi:hypothetical protein
MRRYSDGMLAEDTPSRPETSASEENDVAPVRITRSPRPAVVGVARVAAYLDPPKEVPHAVAGVELALCLGARERRSTAIPAVALRTRRRAGCVYLETMGDDPRLAHRMHSVRAAPGGIRWRAVARHAFRRTLRVRPLMGSAVAVLAPETPVARGDSVAPARADTKRGVGCPADLPIGFKRGVETDPTVVEKRRSRMATLAQRRRHPGPPWAPMAILTGPSLRRREKPAAGSNQQ